jgi:uncharacterized protein (TIGR03435 family)
MLQTLLKDRFKLTMHKESKVLPIYALVVAKGGPKLHEAEAEGGLNIRMSHKGREMKGNVTLTRLADTLSNTLDRPVIDETGLKGTYEIDLTWSPDDAGRTGPRTSMRVATPDPGGPGRGPEAGDPKAEDSADAPPLFIALQATMGLKLEARKSPAEIIVVDMAEKVPTEN